MRILPDIPEVFIGRVGRVKTHEEVAILGKWNHIGLCRWQPRCQSEDENEESDGVTTIDHKEIEGITGGALDANEGEPGPFYIQGDHTGGLKFRNITVSLPKQ